MEAPDDKVFAQYSNKQEDRPVVCGTLLICQRQQLLKGTEQLILDAAACSQQSMSQGQTPRGAPLDTASRVAISSEPYFHRSLHAQPLASSIVSARSEVVLMPLFFSRLLSLRMSFASILTLATSLTMHPILSLEFSSRYLSRVVFPASSTIKAA